MMKRIVKSSTSVTAGAKIYFDSIDDFEPWGQAVENLDIIRENDKEDELDSYISDIYPEGISQTDFNDILAYDWEDLFTQLGIDY